MKIKIVLFVSVVFAFRTIYAKFERGQINCSSARAYTSTNKGTFYQNVMGAV